MILSKSLYVFAVLLWIVVGALLGITLGVMFHLPLYQIIFLAVAGVVNVWLVVINMAPYVPLSTPATTTTAVATKPAQTKVSVPVKQKAASLPPEAARQWLDDFLVRQQRR